MESNPYRTPSAEVAPPAFEHRRPLLITIICVFNFAGSILSAYVMWASLPTVRYQIGLGFAICSVVNWMFSVLCFVGFWRMSKWAVFLYPALIVSGGVIQYLYDLPVSIPAMLPALLVLLAVLIYYRNMRWRV